MAQERRVAAAYAAAALIVAFVACNREPAPRPAPLPDPPSGASHRLDIVDRAIEHHGGELFERARVELTVASRSGSFDVDTTLDGGRFAHRIRASSGSNRREYRRDNDSLEVIEDGEPLEMDESARKRAESYVNQRMYFLFLPYKLNDPGAYKEDLGLEQWGNRQLHRVRVTFERGSSAGADSAYVYWFDPETARLEQFAYDYSEGAGLRFRVLKNYRRIGGLLFYDADNFGLNTRDGGLTVDAVTPEYVSAELPFVSQIELKNIKVERLDG